MINKESTIDGDFRCLFGFTSCIADEITIKNMGGVACVRMNILENTAKLLTERYSKKVNTGGIYKEGNKEMFRNAIITDTSGKEIIRFIGISDVVYTKKNGLVFKAATFKITDNGDIYSKWLIYELEPSRDDIFNEMKSDFDEVQNGNFSWGDKRYWDTIKKAANRLNDFKKNNVIKPKHHNERRSKKSKCWSPGK